MDVIEPVPKSCLGHQYLVVIMDYATWFPEAILMRTAKKEAEELQQVFTQVGLLREIITDQGVNFMSSILRGTGEMLKMKQLQTSLYYSQTSGVIQSHLERDVKKVYSRQ